jgi:hypothetical protein
MKSISPSDWKRPYRYLAAAYFAFVAVAGLVVVQCEWPGWQRYAHEIELNRLLLAALVIYSVLDLIRIPFLSGSAISLGFPVLLIALLARGDPAVPILIGVTGSLLGEFLYSCVCGRLGLKRALLRAVLYAGHHAVASGAAAIAFGLVRLFDSSPHPGIENWEIIGVYVVAYGMFSTLVLWPHDWWVDHLLAQEEGRLPRVEIVSALVVLTPIPVVLTYLYGVTSGLARLVVYFLPVLFLVLLLVARSFAKGEIKNAKADILQLARDLIGSPANLVELTHTAFTGAGHLVKYQWGALYSTEVEGESFRLRGQRQGEDSVEIYGLRGREVPGADAEPSPVGWPDVVEVGKGCLGDVAEQGLPVLCFERAEGSLGETLRVPANTALMILPVRTTERDVVGLLALARPRKLFTRAERDKAEALTKALGNTLKPIMELESKLQNLYEEVERYGHPEPVEEALHDLVRRKVDVPRLMAVIAERAFKTRVRTALREVVSGRSGGGRLALPAKELEEIYREVQGETKGMPEWSSEILEQLQVVTSALSAAFSLRYRWPELAQNPEYEALYAVLAQTMDARTVPDVVAQGPRIEQAIDRLRCGTLVAREAICCQLERLQGVVGLLREAEEADAEVRVACLSETLQQLHAAEESAKKELEAPERFMLEAIAKTWQSVVTNALHAAREGGARLAIGMGSQRVLPLEEVVVQLWVENRGPGLATGMVAEILPSEEYEVGEIGRVELGPLVAGERREADFKIRPGEGWEELHLKFEVRYRDRSRRERQEPFADRVYVREELPPFVEIENPYVAGGALRRGSPLFFGREDVFEFIRRNVGVAAREKQVLLLLGERRTGKTSVLKQLPGQLEDERYVHVFFDCQSLTGSGMAGFFLRLSSAIVQGLEEAGLPVEGLSLAPGDLGDQPQHVFDEEFLPRVWERIGDRSLLLAVDEFEALETRVQEGGLEPAVFPYLRSLMQSQERMAFIFVGAHRMEELTTEYWSTLFNIAKVKRVSFLDRESAERLITEPVQPYGVVYDDLAVAEILRLTAGHPYFLQMVCDCLIEHCIDLERNYVTIQDVRDVRDEITGQGRTHLLFVWKQSGRKEKAVLAALASLLRTRQYVTAADVVEHLADKARDLTDQVAFDLGAVTGALERLINRELVKETSDEPPTYTFTAGLYYELIARYKSLYKVLPQLIGEPAGVSSVPS